MTNTNTKNGNIEQSYGVHLQNMPNTTVEHCAEEISRLGFSVINSGYEETHIELIKHKFDSVLEAYTAEHNKEFLISKDEHNGIRLPLEHDKIFLDLAFNPNVLDLVGYFMDTNFILNQQNGIINPSRNKYNQGQWHRDLPYQHFTSSKPLALNALYCVDDFTLENGGTRVIPCSHKHELFPSEQYIEKHKLQVTAKAGDFIVLDCMLYHAGSENVSDSDRRAINHVYSIPLIKQQIDLSNSTLSTMRLSDYEKKMLGMRYTTVNSVSEYLDLRPKTK